MYELIILSLLMEFPGHGYLIAKIINDMIGPYAKASHGRIYPLLAELEKKGLVVAELEAAGKTGGRQSRRYSITDEGRKRYHRLMMDTNSNPGEYQKLFHYKVTTLSHLKSAERLYLIDHYITFCQAHILHMSNEMEDFKRDIDTYVDFRPSDPEATLIIMQHMIDQWSLELTWARQLRERELARSEGLPHTINTNPSPA